jgi:hypothetical protein
MTPEEWSRLTPEQQAWHLQRMPVAPPPMPAPPPLPAPPPPRPSRLRTRGRVLGGIAVTVAIVGLGVATANRGPTITAPAATTDSCRGAGCTATMDPKFTNADGWGSAVPTPAATVAPAANPAIAASGPPRQISGREWAKIAKEPAAHTGEALIVYGQVKQFDSATGTGTFRANVDGIQHRVSYGYADYKTNTVLEGDQASLGDLVEGDLFRAEVVVAGTYTYETTLGGHLTVPVLAVSKIQVTGSAK